MTARPVCPECGAPATRTQETIWPFRCLWRFDAGAVIRAQRAIVAAADALRDGDPQEAYHQLYGYADPTYTETGDPFERLRAALAARQGENK